MAEAKRYASKSWDWEPPGNAVTMDVYEATDEGPQFTGLLDEFGRRIFRLPEPKPMGFCRG